MKAKNIIIIIFLLNILQVHADDVLRERVYMQTDKELYIAGETVWLKLLTTNASGMPVSFSKVGYVELLGNDAAYKQIKIEINDCVGTGWLDIPAEIPTGYYNLVAYTQYMAGESETVFFRKKVVIINTLQKITFDDENANTANITSRTNKKPLVIAGTLNNTIYSTRTNGKIILNNIPENTASLSVSIVGENLTKNETTQDLQHWKNELKNMIAGNFSNQAMAEYEGHIIRGRLVDAQTGEPQKADVVFPFLAFLGEQLRFFGGKINSNGEIFFTTKRISGLEQVTTTIFNDVNDKKYRVDLVSPFVEHTFAPLPDLQVQKQWGDVLLKRSVGLQSLFAFHGDSLYKFEHEAPFFKLEPDKVFVLDNYTRFSTMEDVVVEIIAFVRFRKIDKKRYLTTMTDDLTGYSQGNTLVLLDGVPIADHDDIYNYNPDLVKQIDIYRSRFVFGGCYFSGIVNFKTFTNDLPAYKLDISSQLLTYETPQAYRHFYVPDYSDENKRKSRLPDFRHTLLWEPELQTHGKATIEIPFITSDLTGDFKVTIEGITQTGEVVCWEDYFEVR